MKLALCQTNIIWENKRANLKAAENFISEAAKNGAELVVFPEMSFTGFTVNAAEMGEGFSDSETVKNVSKLAKKYNISVGFGLIICEDGKNLNRFVIVDGDGEVVDYYDKIHPFSYSEEGKHFIGGNRLCHIKTEDTVWSPFVCYDLRFPEIFSAVSYESSFIAVIANWPASRINQWLYLLRARAVENQCYVAGINRTGEGDGIIYNGCSAVFDCYGNLLTQLGSSEAIAYCDIIPENVDYYRKKFRMKQDRREDLYIGFFNKLKKST